mgnify:CR=1 FL=1
MNHAYIVLLAIGTALAHDTGRRLEMPVGDCEYVHAVSVRPVRGSRFTFTPPTGLAVAV